LGVEHPSQNLHLPTYDSPGGGTDQRFHLLQNYFNVLLTLIYHDNIYIHFNLYTAVIANCVET